MGFELLLAMTIAYYLTRNTVQDLAWKARGEDPPSYRRERERWERKQAKREAGDGPGRKFWRNVWADAVATAEERRARAAEKSAEKRHAKWAEKDTAAAEDEAYEINERVAPDPVAEPPVPMGRCHFCDREFPARDMWPARDDDGDTVDACHPCWHARNHVPEQPDPAAPEPGDAEIIQFADWQRPAATGTEEKENDLSAEITGLRSAVTYAKGGQAAATQAAAQTEVAIAGLQAGGTTGAAVAHLHAAMEGHHANAGHYTTADTELTKQLQVAEAYEANRGAGEREFVTSD